MAKLAEQPESGGDGGWAGLLTYLNKTFDLVRDIFGYALPGGVFLAVGIVSGKLGLDTLDAKLNPYDPPTWVMAFMAVGACYAVGHILVTLAYFLYDAVKLIFAVIPKLEPHLHAFPTEVTKDLIVARRKHPELFPVLDRRETLSVTIAGISAALLLSAYFFYDERSNGRTLLLSVGALMLFDFFTAQLHLYRVRKAIKEASDAVKTELAPGELERLTFGLVKDFLKSEAAGSAPAKPNFDPADLKAKILKVLQEIEEAIKESIQVSSKPAELPADKKGQ